MLPLLFADPLFGWAGHTPEVRVLEVVYFWILCYRTPAMLVSTAFSSFYSGQGKTWVVMLVDMGSVVAQHLPGLGLDFRARRVSRRGHGRRCLGHLRGDRRPRSSCIWCCWHCPVIAAFSGRWTGPSTPLCSAACWRSADRPACRCCWRSPALRFSCSWWAAWGSNELAATNLAFNVSSLAFMPVFGLSTAVSILVGQHLGRNDPDLAARGTWTSLWLATGYMLGVSAMYVFVPDLFLFGFFTGEPTRERRRRSAVDCRRAAAVCGGVQLVRCPEPGLCERHQRRRRHAVCLSARASGWPIVLAVGTWIALRLEAGLHGCWGLVTAWIWILGMVYLARFLRGPLACDAGHRNGTRA